ncbi:MAG TPA: ribose 5-phosphate isomerase B [Bdellovibrionota bacterium]|jgi:ribose 5-phosphate isomerase B
MSKPQWAIACDHAGLSLKKYLIDELKEVNFTDFGTQNGESVDYPDFAAKACRAVLDGKCERAVLVCGTGVGMSIAANKLSGIRAAHVESIFTAQMSGEHNLANVLCLGERVTGTTHAAAMVRAWLNAKFETRHQKRVDKIMNLEKQK